MAATPVVPLTTAGWESAEEGRTRYLSKASQKQPVVSTETDGSSWLRLCFLVLFLCLLTPAILVKLLPGELDLKEPES